jgi:ELWxxDGT repeat protein
MKNKILLTLWFNFFLSFAWGQQATLVKDIYPLRGGGGIRFDGFSSTFSNGKDLFFSSSNSSDGFELWKSDGTESGTVMVKDIESGFYGSNPSNFFNSDNKIYFRISNPFNGNQTIYKTDGTNQGTLPVISNDDIRYSSNFVIDSKVYFSQNSRSIFVFDEEKLKLKLSNNTSTKLYQRNDFPLFFGFEYGLIKQFNDKWIFMAKDSIGRNSLFLSDETKNGTIILRDLNIFSTNLSQLSVNKQIKKVFFPHYENRDGVELWVTDGTIKGTAMIKNIAPAGLSSIDAKWYSDIKPLNNGVVFTADDGKNGRELWFSDGSESGTVMIKEFNVGEVGTTFAKFFKSETDENIVYFQISSDELWKTDGTTGGTKLVFKAPEGTFARQDFYVPSTTYFEQNSGYLYFLVNTVSSSFQPGRYEIWRSNGSSETNVKLGTLTNSESAPYFKIVGNNLFYAGNDTQTGIELWKFPLCTHTAKINTPNGTSFCSGGSVTINGEASGTTNPFTYKWKQGTSDVGTATNLTVSKAGNYILEVTDKGGCTVSTTVDITQTANLPVSISGVNNFCIGQNTTLTATPTGGVAPITYQWKQGSVNIGTNTNTLLATSAGSYSVGITDKNGCTGTSTAYTVTQNPSPNVTISKSGSTDLLPSSSVVLSIPTASGQTYQWSKNGVAISGATNNSYTVNSAGSYTVTAVRNGCSATSETIIANLVTAIEEEPNPSEIKVEVSPNPSKDIFKVQISLVENKSQNLDMTIVDGTGRSIWRKQAKTQGNAHTERINLSSQPSGQYYLQVITQKSSSVFKLVRE